jgi:hypothetical protein
MKNWDQIRLMRNEANLTLKTKALPIPRTQFSKEANANVPQYRTFLLTYSMEESAPVQSGAPSGKDREVVSETVG